MEEEKKKKKKKKKRQEFVEEGNRMRSEAERERQRLVDIKARKLKELQDIGIPDKYRTELAKMKILKV
eukprot:gene24209-9808_t